MEQNIFFNKKENLHYYNNVEKNCDWCNNLIEEAIIIKVFFDRLGSGIRYYCFNCRNKENMLATVVETYVAVVTKNINSACIPIFIHKPTLSDSKNLSVFDIKDINSLGGNTTDKTIYANRESFEGACIGDSLIVSKLDEKDNNLLSVDEGLGLLDDLFKSKPMIEDNSEDVKRLEDKKGSI